MSTLRAVSVIDEIAAERRRQIEGEGWSSEHDDEHNDWSLAKAAATYCMTCTLDGPETTVMQEFGREGTPYRVHSYWPSSWAWQWFKPTTPRRNLIKAAALIVAEIERLDRQP